MTGGAFSHAVAAGLPVPGGEDVYANSDGRTVRGHFWKSDGGGLPVLICPGFTEFCEKFSPAAAHLHARGHSVLIIDWPGQGRSGNFAASDHGVHIDTFEQHLAAMDALIAAVGLTSGRVIILGHSMGGHLALRLASRYGGRVAGTVALSPMMVPRPRPVWLVRMLAGVLVLAGRARHHAPSSPPRRFEDDRLYSPGNRLTRCREGYERQFTWYDDAPELWRAGAS
ncbi:MAG: alpha/beta hydrolase, partial [Pseudomonadota bacterium]|nr:alpha/beta hydrolase [Pseudomonadota bacterium]